MSTRQEILERMRERIATIAEYDQFLGKINYPTRLDFKSTEEEQLEQNFQYLLKKAIDRPETNLINRICFALGLPTLQEASLLAEREGLGLATEANSIAREANDIAVKANRKSKLANWIAFGSFLVAAIALYFAWKQ